MGDMADYYLSSQDPWLDDTEAPYERPVPKTNITCRYCGARHLMWGQSGTGFRLFNRDRSLHTCKQYRK